MHTHHANRKMRMLGVMMQQIEYGAQGDKDSQRQLRKTLKALSD